MKIMPPRPTQLPISRHLIELILVTLCIGLALTAGFYHAQTQNQQKLSVQLRRQLAVCRQAL